ncbi:MAG: dethiobiotin synthase [bacterium]
MQNIFITATDTGVGKTLVSTLLALGFRDKGISCDHFKPVQTGIKKTEKGQLSTDLMFSATFLSQGQDISDYCNERNVYTFSHPVSPHLAAKRERKFIDTSKIISRINEYKKPLIIEGAGGIAVPLSPEYYIFDLINDINLPVIVVSRSKLGTLNHTFLTVNFLKRMGINVAGIVVSGVSKEPSYIEKDNLTMITEMNRIPLLGAIPEIELDVDAGKAPSVPEMRNLARKHFEWNRILETFE